MVKFGVHLEAFLNENLGSELYVVPYREIRDERIEGPTADGGSTCTQHFETEWNACLVKVREDFDAAMCVLWERVFEAIAVNEAESRGAAPDRAFRLFFVHAGVGASQGLLTSINAIYETTLTNAEALRKLVKKFDKHHRQRLSLKLLPKLYASNFVVGQPTLEDGLSILRHALGEDDDCDDDNSSVDSVQKQRRGRQHDATVERRKDELAWLKNLVQSLRKDEVARIVAHRGFHNPRGLSDRRPLENSLQAYEAAWTSGIHLCECDIALTRDEKLVLAHDNDFSRLALDKDSPMFNCQVRDLTFRELISLPLKSGIRPPLLIDVLRSARAIGGNSQLVIEIKPGNNDTAKALARMFIRHPDLMAQCAIIMSFDLYAMHTLRNDLAVLEGGGSGDGRLRPGHRSTMSLGNLSLLVDPADVAAGDIGGFVPLGNHRDSFDHYGVGLSLSTRQTDRDLATNSTTAAQAARAPPVPPEVAPPLPPSAVSSPKTMSKSPSKREVSTLPIEVIGTQRISSPTTVGFGSSPSNGSMHKTFSMDETQLKIPKLLLLTVYDKPKIPCELQVSVEDLSKVEGWLHRADGALDGVYMQFQPEMLEPKGAEALRALATNYSIGVWSYAHRDPDDYDTFLKLIREGGVSYVNTDLPKGFRKRGLMAGLFWGSSRAASLPMDA